jgi:LPS-assembly protein
MLYGEKATISFEEGSLEVLGNVRYVGGQVTLYGTNLFYNFKKDQLVVKNARVTSDNYIVWGEEISRPQKDILEAKNAEYTTCRDCPESWSIFGRNINITVGEYVKIRDAYIKVKGVTVLYVPYIVLPIKKKRESGLLFPSFFFPSGEGLYYRQPWFWAINRSMDMTFTPSFYGLRGHGGEVELRKIWGHGKWIESNSLFIRDKIYDGDHSRKIGDETYRDRLFSQVEYHYALGENFNHHFYYSNGSDLDLIKDFDFFTESKTFGPEWGGNSFLDYRSQFFEISLEGDFRRNLLVDSPKDFDDHFVQILPKLSLSTIPVNLWHSPYPFFKTVNIGLDIDGTVFKQNKFQESGLIRNALRLNNSPFLDLTLFQWGPLDFSTHIKWDVQKYYFPHEKTEKKFSKKGLIFESKMSLELEKIFGLAYEEKLSLTKLDLEKYKNFQERRGDEKNKNKQGEEDLIGVLPDQDDYYKKKNITSRKESYKHSQSFILKHYYLSDQKFEGSQKFLGQIENSSGTFDHIDFLRAKKYVNTQLNPTTSLPLENTLEIQWNHSVLRKSVKNYTPYQDGKSLRDNFNYNESAFLNISQGVDLTVKDEKIVNRLTRLYINGGSTFDKIGTTLSFSEYFFFNDSFKGHKFKVDIGQKIRYGEIALGWEQNTVNGLDPVKNLNFSFKLSPSDIWQFSGDFKWNLLNKINELTFYQISYRPLNNCWGLNWGYKEDLTQKKFIFNFMVNFNDSNFTSLSYF